MTTASAVPAGCIVVGIDGSSSSEQALDWAMRQAAIEHRPLALLHAAHLGAAGGAMWSSVPGADVGRILEDIREAGHLMLVDAARRVERHEAGVVVHQVLSTDDPREALLALAEHASVVVIGSRGRGPVASLLLGSVGVAVSQHASCPVVVIRHDASAGPRHGVLVDVDGTAGSLPAIEFAYRMAASRALPLVAMHVFWDAAHLATGERVVADDERGLDDVRALLSESIAGMREKFPEVECRLSLVRGFRDRELVRASRDMELVVVGSHQRGFVDAFVYGSIAPTIIQHASCDAAVVPCGDLTA